MYTIKEAAVRSGVSVPLLRAWERRYGVVSPARTDSGYRLYDDEAIARLQAMRVLIADGWSPSTAAGRLRGAPGDEISVLLDRAGVAETQPGSDFRAEQASALAGRFVAAAGNLDEAAMEGVLDEMFARGSFEQVASELVMPALIALGDAWASGKVDVAAEHAASGAIERRLGNAFMAAGRPGQDRQIVLVGLPPGAQHDLGALAFATAARRAGIAVRFLGANIPTPDWVESAVRTVAAAAVVGVVTPADQEAAGEVIAALREARPAMAIAVGGSAADGVQDPPGQPLIRLNGGLGESVVLLRDTLKDRRRRV